MIGKWFLVYLYHRYHSCLGTRNQTSSTTTTHFDDPAQGRLKKQKQLLLTYKRAHTRTNGLGFFCFFFSFVEKKKKNSSFSNDGDRTLISKITTIKLFTFCCYQLKIFFFWWQQNFQKTNFSLISHSDFLRLLLFIRSGFLIFWRQKLLLSLIYQ